MTSLKTNNIAIDIGIDDECTISTANRDSKTGNPRYNVETIAAMEESRARIRGEIPTNWHKPNELEQVFNAMLKATG